MSNKKVLVLDVVKESFDYLLKHFSLMKYYWVGVLLPLAAVHHWSGGIIDSTIGVVVGVVIVLTLALTVALIRSVMGQVEMSWSAIIKQFSVGNLWRYLGVLIQVSLLMFQLVAIPAFVAFANYHVILFEQYDNYIFNNLLMVLGAVVTVLYSVIMYCVATVAVINAAGGRRHSIYEGFQMIKGSFVRFFGGLLVTAIPALVLFYVMMIFYASIYVANTGDGYAGIVAISSGVAYLVVCFFQVYFGLLTTIFATKYYMALRKK